MSQRFICADCSQFYTLSYDEQRAYLERGWDLPKRCPACLARRRDERGSTPIRAASPSQQAGPRRSRPSAFAAQPGSLSPEAQDRRVNSWQRGWTNPYARFGWLSLGLAGLVTLGLVLWLGFSVWLLGLAWLLAVNLITLLVYRYDKSIAGGEYTRVPELVLLGLAFLGGWPLAYVAMYHFEDRHKTQKGRFLLFFWAIVALYFVVICGYSASG